jgi:hypothetical protein
VQDDDRELGDIAQEYARRGWSVLPLHTVVDERCSCGKANCQSPGKHPILANGVTGASSDPEIVRSWWDKTPWANIGIATGERSGIAVVDVDVRNGGMSHLAELDLPDTLAVRSGSGGLHFYFELRHPLRSRHGQKAIAQGVDLQADGVYVVAPPSVHLLGEYKWLNQLPLAPLPAVAIGGTKATTETSTIPPPNGHAHIIVQPDQKEWVADLLKADCPQGERNVTLTRLAGFLRNLLPEPVALQIARTWNHDHCKPPLDDDEVVQNVRHKYQRYEGEPAPGSLTMPRLWMDTELMATEFPEPVWIVEGLLPEGLTVLGGRPKRGKSWMALQIAQAVATGDSTLGRTVAAGTAFYIALEDNPKRIKGRMTLMRHRQTSRLGFAYDWPALDRGGLEFIRQLIEEHAPILIVIDTISRITGRGRDQDSNADMTDLLHPLQQLALTRSMSITLIDHHKKPGMDINDAIDDIMGSTAKTGVADCIWGLYRKSGQSTASLKITGRDVEETELAMVWDGMHFQWRVEGTVEETSMARRMKELLIFADQIGEVSTKAVEERLEISHPTAFELIREAKARRLVKERAESVKGGGARYLYRLTIAGKSEVLGYGRQSDEVE